MFSPVPDQPVLQRSGARNSMRRERMTSEIARCLAMATIALVLLTAHLLTLAQTTEPTQPHRTGVLHPAPTSPKPPSVATDAQPLKCQPAKLLLSLRKHDMPDVVGCIPDIVERSLKQADRGVKEPVPEASNLPKGVVSGQAPLPGKKLMSNTQVTLYISTGPGRDASPGSNVQPASAATSSAGFQEPAMTTVPPPAAVSVAAPVAEPVAVAKPVTKSVTKPVATPIPPPPWRVPPSASTVPSVTGKTPAEALVILRKTGFATGEVTPELTLDGTGRISRQEPVAGSRFAKGGIVWLWRSYAWFSTMSVAVVSLLILGSVAGLALTHLGAKRRLAHTRAVLRIQPSLARDGEAQFDRTIPPAGPALGLRASLQPGEVHFTGPVPIERQEIQHD